MKEGKGEEQEKTKGEGERKRVTLVVVVVVVVSGFYMRPTVVQTGPFWYLSVGSITRITCPIQ